MTSTESPFTSPLRIQDVRVENLPTHSPIPERQLNGGLYTGEPFRPNAPWRNFPAVPSSDVLLREQLTSAVPPPGAQLLYPSGNERPGNSRISLPGVRVYDQHRFGDFKCATYPSGAPTPVISPVSGRPQKFAGHAYL